MDFEMNAFDHVSIITKDVDKSRHFYCTVLGMEEVPRPTNFKFGGAWFRKGNAEIHLVHVDDATQVSGDPENPGKPNGDVTYARHFAFRISDMDAFAKQLEKHDIPFAWGPRNRGDGAWQAYFYDPDGHLVEVTTPKPD